MFIKIILTMLNVILLIYVTQIWNKELHSNIKDICGILCWITLELTLFIWIM